MPRSVVQNERTFGMGNYPSVDGPNDHLERALARARTPAPLARSGLQETTRRHGDCHGA
jgi:hypothetical protein